MSEMVERVAKAILEAMELADGLDAEAATTYARAAIEAMREPSEAMKAVTVQAGTGSPLRHWWNGMIDAALAEPKS